MGFTPASGASVSGGAIGGGRRCAAAGRAASLALLLAVVAFPASVQAQATVNPHVVWFVASPDHNATSKGQPLVASYDLEIFEVGATRPSIVLGLGKPDVRADGTIVVEIGSLLRSAPPTGLPLEARVVVWGPGGSGASDRSNVFAYETCPVSVNPPTVLIPRAGGTGDVFVSADGACAWHARNAADWFTVARGSAGVGAGIVTVTVSPNPGTGERDATLWVGSQSVAIVQRGVEAGAVRVTSPASGARLIAPARVTIRVAFAAGVAAAVGPRPARDRARTDRAVARVDFYVNGRRAGSASASPYRMLWSTARAGTYTIVAIATDFRGAQSWSDPVTVTVEGASAPLLPAKPRK